MRFFLYGTLTADSDNHVARWLHTLLDPGMAATTRGTLYAIEDEHGWYPGLVPDPRGGPVHGFLHESAGRFAPAALAALDHYENYDPLAPDLSEFVRRKITVETGGRRLSAIAYILRVPPVKDILTVADGCFAGFLRLRGLRPFGMAEPPPA